MHFYIGRQDCDEQPCRHNFELFSKSGKVLEEYIKYPVFILQVSVGIEGEEAETYQLDLID